MKRVLVLVVALAALAGGAPVAAEEGPVAVAMGPPAVDPPSGPYLRPGGFGPKSCFGGGKCVILDHPAVGRTGSWPWSIFNCYPELVQGGQAILGCPHAD